MSADTDFQEEQIVGVILADIFQIVNQVTKMSAVMTFL